MADEAVVYTGMVIRVGNLAYQGVERFYQADVSAANGPTPGAITVSTSGTDVDLSQLATPGLVRIKNLDTVNFVDWGTSDEDGTFHPVGRLLPGEQAVFRLYPNL